MDQIKNPYCRIHFINCHSIDYDYTICPINEVNEQIEPIVEAEFYCDESGFEDWKEKGYLPEVKISLVMMTDEEYDKWVKENVEDKA